MSRTDRANNRFLQRAEAYNAAAQLQAERIAAGWDERPAEGQPATGPELARRWDYSPSPTPAADFWQVHDQTLASLLPAAQSPQDVAKAHRTAEQAALQQVYPQRYQLLTDLAPETAVKRANALAALADRHRADVPAPADVPPLLPPSVAGSVPPGVPTNG